MKKDSLFAFEHEMSKFYNAIGCEGHHILYVMLQPNIQKGFIISLKERNQRNGFFVFAEKIDFFRVLGRLLHLSQISLYKRKNSQFGLFCETLALAANIMAGS